MPGEYTVKLNVDGATAQETLTVKMDPRVKVSPQDLQAQFELAERILAKSAEVNSAERAAGSVQQQLKDVAPKVTSRKALANEVDSLEQKISAVLGAQAASPLALSNGPAAVDRTTLRYVSGELGQLERVVESDDVAPSADAVTAFGQDSQIADGAVQRWQAIVSEDLLRLNNELRRAHMEAIEPGARN